MITTKAIFKPPTTQPLTGGTDTSNKEKSNHTTTNPPHFKHPHDNEKVFRLKTQITYSRKPSQYKPLQIHPTESVNQNPTFQNNNTNSPTSTTTLSTKHPKNQSDNHLRHNQVSQTEKSCVPQSVIPWSM